MKLMKYKDDGRELIGWKESGGPGALWDECNLNSNP